MQRLSDIALAALLFASGCRAEPTAPQREPSRVVETVEASHRPRTGPPAARRASRPRRTTPAIRQRPRPRTPPARPHPVCARLQAPSDPEDPALPVVDASHNLDHFFGRLLALTRPGKRARKVRIAFYGDSNATMDWAASHLRRLLGRHFGHGGHGYITAGRSVPWYQHREVRTWSSRGWRAYCVTTPRINKRPYYGHAGHLSLGRRMGSFAHFESADSGSPQDEAFSRLQVHYLCWPLGGRFEVLVDGKVGREVDTRCDKRQARRQDLTVPPGRHKVRLRVTRTLVAVHGAAFENDRPGVVVDGLGVGALNVKTLREIKAPLFEAGLRARGYDLVILHTGTNMWGPGFHPGWAREVLRRIRRALGAKVSVLLLSPPAFGRWKKGRIQGHKRMAACAREKRVIAAANGVAFWDYFQSMGGLESVAKWRASGHIQGDLVHLKPEFHGLMMKRLHRALMHRFADYLRRKSILCPAPKEAPRHE